MAVENAPYEAATPAEIADAAERQNRERLSEQEEPIWPRREKADALTVVGIGASAGGVRALQTFFEAASVDSGAAFVVVMHLSANHESHLAHVLSHATTMPVQQVTEGVRLDANQVYVIPPSKALMVRDGMLLLADPEPTRGHRIVIDRFFRALADAYGSQTTGVVLSGAGADGMLGLKQIKEMGGLTIAQEPTEAEHEGMPRSAIATGMVDYVLPAREIAAQIVAYWNTSRRMRLPHEAAPSPEQSEEGPLQEESLRDILSHLRAHTGHDFANYKRATVLRRIGRRLQVNGQESLPAYLDYLRRHPAEVGELVGDLLISVTQFFRDPASWEALEIGILPRLIENQPHDQVFRAWVCGCATGEEAYSLAMLLHEVAQRQDRPLQIQIFATDMDTSAIAHARNGIYPDTIAGDLTPERLRRWFTRQSGQCQVKKEIRECVLFAAHDVLRDTPFSRLNLVTCRNLLIYLKRSAQEQIYGTFHFALRPDGRLFLGQSESVDASSTLFSATDKLHRIYSRRPMARPLPLAQSLPLRSVPVPVSVPVQRPGVVPLAVVYPNDPPTVPNGTLETRPARADELHRAVLERYAPPSALVTNHYEILHLSDGVTAFLRLSGGTPSANLLRLVHPELRIDLRTALYAAAADGTDQVRLARAALRPASDPSYVRILVRPVREVEGMDGYFLVLFEEMPTEVQSLGLSLTAGTKSTQESSAALLLAQQLEDEISRLQIQLRSTVEQYEASGEELKASNEELQAMNEELRSSAEELETSTEELQSVNEELTTVNQELKSRMDELSQANGDLQNLLASIDIGIIFLDRALCVQRYTPAIETLFNVIPTDIGRPLAHLTHRLETDTLPELAEAVLQNLAVVEREINADGNRHFLARLRPYRTLDDRIDGVILAFIDITERKRAEAALKQSEEQFRLLVEGAQDYAMLMMDRERHIVFWSRGAERVFGWNEAEVIGQQYDLIFTSEDRAGSVPEKEALTAWTEGIALYQRWHIRKDGSRLWADGTMRRLEDATPERSFVKIARDTSEKRQSDEALNLAHTNLEQHVTERTQDLATLNQEQIVLFQQLMAAQEEERQRISRELHDETGQDLTALLLGLDALQGMSDPARMHEIVPRLQQSGEKLAKKLHEIAVTMRPTSLDDMGLEEALRTHVGDWSTQNGVPAEFEVTGSSRDRLPTEVELTVYRVVQESLNNVLKHAGPVTPVTRVSVILQMKPQEVMAIIEDNGDGFDAENLAVPSTGRRRPLGILGMRERATQVGGAVTVESSPGHGTTVYLRIPLARGEAFHLSPHAR